MLAFISTYLLTSAFLGGLALAAIVLFALSFASESDEEMAPLFQ